MESGLPIEFPAGALLAGRYRIRAVLGGGAMGMVYAATDERAQRPVAIKVLHPDCAERPELVARFALEARAAQRIEHPGVVRVLEFGRHEGRPYLTMEHIDGEDLRAVLSRQGLPAVERVVRWGVELCAAIEAAHALGIVHRDIKPSNLLITSDGDHLKVLDFGLAKQPGTVLTASGQVFGTLAYMPPEQLTSAKSVGPTADIYAIGVLLYECLSGALPFVEASNSALILRIVNDPPPPIRRALPEGLAELVGQCLAKGAAERFASCAALGTALSTYLPAVLERDSVRPLAPPIPVSEYPKPGGSSE